MSELAAVAAATMAPILRDDLLVDESQLYHARLHGADAAVLPAAELDATALEDLVRVASSLHMGSVIEVLGPADLAAAARLPHVLLGLRCVQPDGRLDVPQSLRLAQQAPGHTLLILPPIESAEQCAALRGRVDGVFVDAARLATGDVSATL